MGHKVKCFYCGSVFDRDKEPFEQIPGKKRYAHKDCYLRMVAIQRADAESKEQLENYIKQLFNYKEVPEIVQKQIRKFITENNYTYKGILNSLRYFYEVKHGSKEKAYGRIGIVPYVYQDAHNYYYSLWESKQRNQVKIQLIEPELELPATEVHITMPERKPMRHRKKVFTFLEEDGGVNE